MDVIYQSAFIYLNCSEFNTCAGLGYLFKKYTCIHIYIYIYIYIYILNRYVLEEICIILNFFFFLILISSWTYLYKMYFILSLDLQHIYI